MTASKQTEDAAIADAAMQQLGPIVLRHGRVAPIEAFKLGWTAHAERVEAQRSVAPILGYRYSRDKGESWHLCDNDPTDLMPDSGGIVVSLIDSATI